MKPIEPGCLALILRGNMKNHVVTAVSRIAPGESITYHPGRSWANERQMKVSSASWECDSASDPEVSWNVAENNLMRIDGGDELIEQDDDLEVTA